MEGGVELGSSKIGWGFDEATSFWSCLPPSIGEDDEEQKAASFVGVGVEVGGAGEETRLRRLAAGCLNRSIIVFEDAAISVFRLFTAELGVE